MTEKELKEILDEHKKWLITRCCGITEGGRADLVGANLGGADLGGANLGDANLGDVDLRGADLGDANLGEADLRGADLGDANLGEADLRGANLGGADLRGADLRGADLRGANLGDANLGEADLRGADLGDANLERARYNHMTAFFAMQCPEEGSFIGYKKAGGKIVKLLIPEDAKRSSATSRKCRCSKAIVLSITNKDGSDCEMDSVSSDFINAFIYTVGEAVEEPDFDDDRWNECSRGIHFFITRDEAVRY